MCAVFFFNDTATTEIYTLSLHDALPICRNLAVWLHEALDDFSADTLRFYLASILPETNDVNFSWREFQERRSEEHTSELQSRQYLVCRLLLEKNRSEEHTSELQSRQYLV